MKKRTINYNRQILAVLLILSLLCSIISSMWLEKAEYLGNEVLYISTASFSETNTAASGSTKEYQMSGTAKLTQEGTVELVPDAAGTEGGLSSGKLITITSGFSTVFKLSMGAGTDFLAGSFQVLFTGSGSNAGNGISFDINWKSDTEIAAVVRKITGEKEEKTESIMADFTADGTVETELYCWLDYLPDTDKFQVFLSVTNVRPETPQAVYQGLGVNAHIGSSCYIGFSAKNPQDAYQKVSICSFLLDDKYCLGGIDISTYEEGETVDNTYHQNYNIQKLTYTLTIHYLHEDGKTAAADYTGTYQQGQAYSVVSPDVAGYVPDCRKVTGVFGTANLELTVTYAKILIYSDLPGPPEADITCQSQPEDVWAEVTATDTIAAEGTYQNTSRPIMVSVSQWDDSSMAGVEVRAFQMLQMGVDGYEIQPAYQTFFDNAMNVTNVTALEVQKWLLNMNNQETVAFIKEMLEYIKTNQIEAVSGIVGTVGDVSVTLDCSRRYEQTKGYHGGYGYYILYSEDNAGEEYVLTEFTSLTSEYSVYLKGNSLSLIKEAGKQDYSMNEDIVFTISSTIPNVGAAVNIENYHYYITDTFDKGITPDINTLNAQVIDADKNITELTKSDDYSLSLTGNTLTITCNFATGTHLKDNRQKGKTLRITYEAVLNEHAVIGPAGNENKAFLTYTENPAEEIYVDKTTEESRVVVFTYRLEMRKVGSDGFNLGNVPFGVYDQSGAQIFFVKGEDGVYRPAKENSQAALSQITTADDGTLYIEGVGTGEYTFQEIEAPDGYLSIPKFTLFVSPVYMDSAVISLAADIDDRSYIKQVGCYLDSGKISVIVLDPVKAGQLPRTGGIERMLTYLAGAVLIGIGIVIKGSRHRKEKL